MSTTVPNFLAVLLATHTNQLLISSALLVAPNPLLTDHTLLFTSILFDIAHQNCPETSI